MGGLEVLRAIHGEGTNRHTPVIVITIVTERGAVAGFAVHDLLTKPLDSTALLASLKRAEIAEELSGVVLVVDDDAASLRLMAVTLAQLGYSANCVQRGDDGLSVARGAPPLAVVLDLLMPQMDGFEFLDRFRQLPLCRRVPVIVWTAKDLTANEHSRLRATAQGVVNKGREGSVAVVEELKTILAMRRA